MTRARLLLLALATVLLLASCGDDPGYEPKPSKALFSEIGALEGVTQVDVGAYESAGLGGSRPAYRGQVRIDDQHDPATILDQVLAILWQGMPDADLSNVKIRQGDTFYDTSSVALGDARRKERYGPQPGPGVPPKDKPALELHG